MELEELKESIIKECTGYYDAGRFNKIFHKPKVLQTSEFNILDNKIDYKSSITLGLSLGFPLLVISIFAFIIASIINHFLTDDKFNFITVLIFIAVYIIEFVIYKNVGALRREIRVDKFGVAFSGEKYNWKDIYGTFIMLVILPTDTPTRFLILVDNYGIITSYEITYQACSTNLLANIIEHYKKENASS